MIGDFLFQLQGLRDESAPVIQRVLARNTSTAAAAVLTMNMFDVPADKALLLTLFNVSGIAGAAQTVDRFRLLIVDPVTGSTLASLRDELVNPPAPAAANVGVSDTSYHLIVMPGERLFAQVNFSAGAAVNNTDGSVIGFLLPKGNLQFR